MGLLMLVRVLLQVDRDELGATHRLLKRLLDGFSPSQRVCFSSRILRDELELQVVGVLDPGADSCVGLPLADAVGARCVAVALAVLALVIAASGSCKKSVAPGPGRR